MRDLPIFSNRTAPGRKVNAVWFRVKDFLESVSQAWHKLMR